MDPQLQLTEFKKKPEQCQTLARQLRIATIRWISFVKPVLWVLQSVVWKLEKKLYSQLGHYGKIQEINSKVSNGLWERGGVGGKKNAPSSSTNPPVVFSNEDMQNKKGSCWNLSLVFQISYFPVYHASLGTWLSFSHVWFQYRIFSIFLFLTLLLSPL